MNLIISKFVDAETIIANKLKNYFADEIKFSTLFPDTEIKIGTTHPFVNLLQQEIPEGEKYDLKGFPSITVIDTNDSEGLESPTTPLIYKIDSGIVTDIKT